MGIEGHRGVSPVGDGARTRALRFSVLAGGSLVIATEFLSLFRWLHGGPVVALWAVSVILVAVRSRRTVLASPPAPDHHVLVLLVAAALVLGVILLIGVVAVPNTWDSMTYHLPRVGHWIQNGTVGHYPTNIDRQNYQPPFAEYVIAHLRLLTGSVQSANLVQWFALVGSATAVSELTRRLRGGALAQAAAALIAVSVPMAIVQGSSTQNDLVVTYWLVVVAVLVLRVLDRRPSIVDAATVGVAVGLLALTKGTGTLFALPVVGVAAVLLVRRAGLSRALALAAVAMTASVLVVGPHLFRNSATYGSPTGPDTGTYANGTLDPRAWVSNLIRTSALQIAVPDTELDERAVATFVRVSHWAMGWDADDPASTWPGTKFEPLEGLPTGDDRTPSPLHALLVAGVLVVAGVAGTTRERLVAAWVATGYVLSNLVLRWQPWHNRLVLPGQVLSVL